MANPRNPLLRPSLAALFLGLLALILAGLSGPLYRFEILRETMALTLFHAGATLGLGAAILGGFAIIADLLRKARRLHVVEGGLGFVIGLALFTAGYASKQMAAYPDVHPIELEITHQEAFDLALRTAEGLGWQVVAVEREEGRIEATDTTVFFGFKDDVVIRIKEESPGITRVDVNSVRRVGQSDVGANTARIRRYLAQLTAQSVMAD